MPMIHSCIQILRMTEQFFFDEAAQTCGLGSARFSTNLLDDEQARQFFVCIVVLQHMSQFSTSLAVTHCESPLLIGACRRRTDYNKELHYKLRHAF